MINPAGTLVASIQFVPQGIQGGPKSYGTYLLVMTDNSGNLSDGDNAIVTVQRYNNNVAQGDPQVLNVVGQSYQLFTGLVSYPPDLNITYTILSVVQGTPSPPAQPDLKIVSVDVTKKADSSGNNGLVNINATSSNKPIQYFIDDVAAVTVGNVVTSGVHTAKVIDPLGTVVTQQFTVLQADAFLYKDPSVTVYGSVSRWNAAFNPVVFEYHREDFDVQSVIASTLADGNIQITVNTIATTVPVGAYVYIKTPKYYGVYVVTYVNNSNQIGLNCPYTADDNGGFANIDALKPYYKVVTYIKYIDPVTGNFNTIVSTNRPNTAGIVKADISSFLQSILKPAVDNSDYTRVNYRDANLSASYQISYAEVWDGNTPQVIALQPTFYVVYSAMQIQTQYGGNLFNFVTQPGGGQLAKWLTDFVEPSYSVNFPFDLPFIYSEQVAGRQIYYTINALDINKQPLGTATVTEFLLNEDASYLLNQDSTKLIIARADITNTPIVEYVGLNRLLINQDFGPTCAYIQVQLFYASTDLVPVPVPITQPITVRVDHTLTTNAVYVRWIGLNGSWNYYRFNYNQTVTLDIQNPVIVKGYVSDYENAQAVESVISKDAGKKTQLYADLIDNNDRNGLESIKYSPMVQILTSSNPVKWQTVVVNSSTFTEGETINGQTDFSITFNSPSKNIQTQ